MRVAKHSFAKHVICTDSVPVCTYRCIAATAFVAEKLNLTQGYGSMRQITPQKVFHKECLKNGKYVYAGHSVCPRLTKI